MQLPDVVQAESAIVQMTNAFRAEQKLAPVTVNPTLTAAARAFAQYLAQTGKFGHEVDGRKPWDRTVAAGYKHCLVAENLASGLDSRGFETKGLATFAVEGWKNSPPHRANLVLPHVTEIGIGVVQAPDKHPKYIAVQLFGRPEALKYSFRVENRAGADVSYSFAGRAHALTSNASITHTACEPGSVAFTRSGNFLTGTALSARFEARDGAVYRVRTDAAGAVTVETTPAAAPRR